MDAAVVSLAEIDRNSWHYSRVQMGSQPRDDDLYAIKDRHFQAFSHPLHFNSLDV